MKNKNNTVMSSFIDRFSFGLKPLTYDEYKNTVIRDIFYLLSTTSHFETNAIENLDAVRRSVLNYGITSVAGATKAYIKIKLLNEIREKLIYFEPRLLSDSIIVQEVADNNTNAFNISINAILCLPEAKEEINLILSVDIESGHIREA
jgi:type VI secretion system protein ImpF